MKTTTLPSAGLNLLAVGLFAAGSISSHAIDAAWTGSTNGTWATEANWNTAPVPGIGEMAIFGNPGNSNTVIDLGDGVTVGWLSFDPSAAAYTIGSGGAGVQNLTLDTLNGGVTLGSGLANDQKIDANIGLSVTGTYATGILNESDRLLTVAGGIKASTTGLKTLTVDGGGNTTIEGNAVDGVGTLALVKAGGGRLRLSGNNVLTGTLWVSDGRLDITAGTTLAGPTTITGTMPRVGNLANTTAVVAISPDAALTWGGFGGKIAGEAASITGASGALYNAGGFNQAATGSSAANGIYLGGGGNCYGYIRNSGTTVVQGRLWIASGEAAAGAVGVLDVRGGTVTVNGNNQTLNGPLRINSDGNAHATSRSYAGVNLVNGTLQIVKAAGVQTLLAGNNTQNAYTSMNITGTGKFIAGNAGTDSGFGLGAGNFANNTTTFAVADGGTLEATYIYGLNTLGVSVLTFDDATVRSRGSNVTGLIQGTNIKTHIHGGGVTFDTNTYNTIVANPLLAPTGNGVTEITLGGTLTGYVGAPVVEISGGDGIGAAAVANFDPATGTITSITVTSPGSGYTTAPTVRLFGGNGGSTGAAQGTATATAAIGPVTGGGLKKTGEGMLSLNGANTYTGDTTIEAGTLAIAQATLADASTVRITTGAKLRLPHGGPDVVHALYVDGVLKPAGTYHIGNAAFIEGTGSLVVSTGSAASAYDSWLTGHGLTPGAANTGVAENYDGSGVLNLIQFALGGNPANPANNGVQAMYTKDASNSDNLVLTIAVLEGANFAGGPTATTGGVTYVVEGGTTLAAWDGTVEEVAVQNGGGSMTAPAGYVLKSFKLVQSPALGSKGFLRVRVNQP